MKKRSENIVVAIFGLLFLFAIIMIFNQGIRTTGYATTATTSSNVTISTYFAIDMSINLSDGIQFGSISTLPATDQNATHNHDGENTTGDGTGTSMWMNVSSDSNSAVDFCIKADALNTSTGDEIGLGNESYHNSTGTYTADPSVIQEVSLTTDYVSSGANIPVGSNNYYRFWLDVPAATATGTYNNTVSFKGVQTTTAC